MDIKWNAGYIDLQNLISLSRGDKGRMLKYLNQFQELIPERVGELKEHLEERNRKMIRQVLHKMSPQLQFFGVPDVLTPIRRLEHEYETMPMEELTNIVYDLIGKLEGANSEVEMIIKNHF